MFLARIFVSLKTSINDPQGQTIQDALLQLGFNTVRDVRAGKYMEVKLDEHSAELASQRVVEICDKLLANPIIENYHFELERTSEN